jgi:hypothetical protein
MPVMYASLMLISGKIGTFSDFMCKASEREGGCITYRTGSHTIGEIERKKRW